ncbi:thioesterase family protein [Clostridium aestuarii]|uniref:Thioesterase family protein n=1 Tax=Clostridium aestuarii TaxID=338193 RepID=A0ABT4D257_9CLOT|nr:thioesterase family protein [Clostridium aestuarii]MCY6485316.1 thioesterase family protein [Clostridium aestuarii]
MHINKTTIKVRYVETDKMGIVHHSNYYAWFELGRGEFITESGITYRDIEEKGVMLPVLESSCKYIMGAKYEDEVIIETWIEEMNGAKIIFNYNVVRKEDKKLLAKGSTTHAFVGENFKIINIKKKKPEMWEKLQKLYTDKYYSI